MFAMLHGVLYELKARESGVEEVQNVIRMVLAETRIQPTLTEFPFTVRNQGWG